jgi:hypothetical protein
MFSDISKPFLYQFRHKKPEEKIRTHPGNPHASFSETHISNKRTRNTPAHMEKTAAHTA